MLFRGYHSGLKLKRILAGHGYSVQLYTDFTIADCPILIRDSEVALSGCYSATDVLKYDWIIRGDEETGIFEGDVVVEEETEEVIGYVTYKCGFHVQGCDGSLKKLKDLSHIKMINGSKETISLLKRENRSPIRFSADGLCFSIKSIMCKSADSLYVVDSSNVVRVDVDRVRDATGFIVNGKELAYGDRVQGGKIVMHEGLPMLARGNIYTRLEEVFKDDGIEEYKGSERIDN